MATRRAFLGAAAGVAAALRDDGIERIVAAGRAVTGRTPQDLASDEGYWAEVRRAFDVNAAYLNLNNGGVSPSPRAVTESMAAWLALSNQAPAHTLWELAEPQVEGGAKPAKASAARRRSSRSPATPARA